METTIGLKLSEAEQQLFNELYADFDADNRGFISHAKLIELLNSTLLSPQIQTQIMALSGASRMSHLGRSQLFIVLKLIGAAQSGLPLTADTLSSGRTLPLPQLLPKSDSIISGNSIENIETETKTDTSHHLISAHLPPPPNKTNIRPNRQWNNQFVNEDFNHDFTSRLFITSPPNHITSISINNNNNINLIVNDEPEKLNSRSSSANELNSSPTDSIDKDYTFGEKSWSEFREKEKDKPINWADFDEGHHLLENEEVDDDDDEEQCEDKNSCSSSSSDEESHDIWNISEEQRNYYMNQFKTMQMNLNGKITGNTAKEFFEKSALPIHELSQIWQLSDIDKDGALTLNEFCIAMHLVVLRRNHIYLPDKLPLTLVSTIDNQILNHNSSKTSDIPIIPINPSNEPINSISPNYIDLSEEVVIKSNQDVDTLSPQNKQWTKFSDSPTNNIAVTAISSPPSTSSSASGMHTLANFDFNAALIVKDPKILHPVALRVSPDGQPINYNINETNHDLGAISPLISNLETLRMSSTVVNNSVSHPYVNTNNNNSGKKDPPPPPPPRPIKVHGHTRSSSLDLNRLNSRSSLTTDVSVIQNPHLKVSNSEYGLICPLKEPAHISLKSRHFGAFVAYKKDKEKLETSLFINSKFDALRIKYKLPTEVPQPKNLNDNFELLETIEALRAYSNSLVNINNAILEELIEVTESRNKFESQLAKLNGCKF